MSSHQRLAVVFAIGFLAMSAQAQQAEPAASKPSVIKDCKGLKTQALRECQKVARPMAESARSAEQPETTTTDANDVHHSSPVMTTKEERVVADTRKKGKDPQKELEKLKKDADVNPTPPQNSPQ